MKLLLSDQLIHSLGWTLLHSLWQAALVALLVYLIMAFRKKATAHFRYGIATGALTLIVLMAALTFCYEYLRVPKKNMSAPLTETPVVVYTYALPPAQEIPVFPEVAENKTADISFAAMARIADRYMYSVVIGWTLGVLLLSFRFLGGWAFTRRLKHHPGNLPLDGWQQKAQKLAESLHLTKSVQVVTSHSANVPMVIGHLKPLILLPASLLASLPPEQIEAVLAHELAHIHRKDYWVNMLQSLAEIIFFYHPAVWWISSVIRTERENCCDDLAVRICGSTLTYAKALTHMEEVRQQSIGLAMAATGKKGSLFQRIERLVHPGADHFSGRYMYAVLTLLLLLVISAGTGMAFKMYNGNLSQPFNINSTNQYTPRIASDKNQDASQVPETLKSHPKEGPWVSKGFSSDEAAIAVLFQERPNNMKDTVPPEGKEKDHLLLFKGDTTFTFIPNFDFNIDSLVSFDFHLDMDSILRDTLAGNFSFHFQNDSIAWDHFKLFAPHWAYAYGFHVGPGTMPMVWDTLWPPHLSIPDSLLRIKLRSLDSLRALYDPFQDAELRKNIENAMRKVERDINRIQLQLQDSLANLNFEHLQSQLERSEEMLRMQSEALARQAEELRRQAEKMESRSAELQARAEAKAHDKENSFDEATRVLEQELLKDGLIKKEEQYKFEMSPGQLKINGKKQPKKVYQKYADLLAREMNLNMVQGNNFSLTKTPY